ncbi:MAG: Mth938-like domain-containing protein [Candidatus Competibacterales bacterium]
MHLSLDRDRTLNTIRAYREGALTVNDGMVVERSLLIMPDQLVTDWPPQSLGELEPQHCERLAELEPELVILGTGAQQQFPHPRLTQGLLERQIGVEVMATGPACRTYNIVCAEGRRVLAALFMI